MKYLYNTIVILLLLVGAVIVVLNFAHFGNVEFTDNARVRQHITPQNTRVQGFVREVRFEEFQQVRKGDTLCVIEAMKLMNEIPAEQDGVITGILVKNGQTVEYGTPLFQIGG